MSIIPGSDRDGTSPDPMRQCLRCRRPIPLDATICPECRATLADGSPFENGPSTTIRQNFTAILVHGGLILLTIIAVNVMFFATCFTLANAFAPSHSNIPSDIGFVVTIYASVLMAGGTGYLLAWLFFRRRK